MVFVLHEHNNDDDEDDEKQANAGCWQPTGCFSLNADKQSTTAGA